MRSNINVLITLCAGLVYAGLLYGAAPCSLPRVYSLYFDLGRVYPLCLKAGDKSLIRFPTPISDSVAGSDQDVVAKVDLSDAHFLHVELSRGQALATNLQVISGKRVYNFDIVPSSSSNADYVNIVAAFNGPQLYDSDGKRLVALSGVSQPRPDQIKVGWAHSTAHDWIKRQAAERQSPTVKREVPAPGVRGQVFSSIEGEK